MKITIYPRIPNNEGIRLNPYISDFINALEQNGVTIANPPHKNPLFSLLFRKTDSDAYIFHWLENVPDYKYGMAQTIAAVWLLLKIKLKRKKIIWFLHNKQSHSAKHKSAKKLLIQQLIHQADLIATHATEGVELIQKHYPKASTKVHFLHHPTKNRITIAPKCNPETDLLIWGNISPYKGVLEFVRFSIKHSLNLKTKIIGQCSSKELFQQLSFHSNDSIFIENRSIPFEELEKEIQKAKFVLVPYAAESILSSGILMDSLSYGAKVIGPNVGSFRDYANEPLLNVYTFNTFADISDIVQKEQEAINPENYHQFLNAHSWEKFGENFYRQLQKITKQ